jgi:hypothetical protein
VNTIVNHPGGGEPVKGDSIVGQNIDFGMRRKLYNNPFEVEVTFKNPLYFCAVFS